MLFVQIFSIQKNKNFFLNSSTTVRGILPLTPQQLCGKEASVTNSNAPVKKPALIRLQNCLRQDKALSFGCAARVELPLLGWLGGHGAAESLWPAKARTPGAGRGSDCRTSKPRPLGTQTQVRECLSWKGALEVL